MISKRNLFSYANHIVFYFLLASAPMAIGTSAAVAQSKNPTTSAPVIPGMNQQNPGQQQKSCSQHTVKFKYHCELLNGSECGKNSPRVLVDGANCPSHCNQFNGGSVQANVCEWQPNAGGGCVVKEQFIKPQIGKCLDKPSFKPH